jgi:hypothetical protein
MTFSSASWGFDPQTASGDEIVRERMPERMSLRLDEPAHGKKPKPWFLRSALIRSMRWRKA